VTTLGLFADSIGRILMQLMSFWATLILIGLGLVGIVLFTVGPIIMLFNVLRPVRARSRYQSDNQSRNSIESARD
jgi:hypothetical protein